MSQNSQENEAKPSLSLILGGEPLRLPMTGIGRYTWELARYFEGRPDVDIRYFSHAGWMKNPLAGGPVAEADQRNSLQYRAYLAIRNFASQSPLATKLYGLVRPELAAWRLKREKLAVFHSPNFILPPHPGPKVVTIHDLSILRFPETQPRARVQLMRKALDYAFKQADHVLTDSAFMRQEIIEYGLLPEHKISAVHLGYDDKQFYPRSAQVAQPVLDDLGLDYEAYFLFVSTIEPRKNLMQLLAAFEQYWQNHPKPYPLVISGGRGWNSDAIHKKIQSMQALGMLRYLGYAKHEQLPDLYAGARALLFPSRYEGFGLPVLEAMASATAVMTSEHSAMSEICGQAALLVGVDDTATMVKHIQSLTDDETVLKNCVEAGLQRVKAFSWDKCAEETLAVYQQLIRETAD